MLNMKRKKRVVAVGASFPINFMKIPETAKQSIADSIRQDPRIRCGECSIF